MTTSPYALVQMSIDGGAVQFGGLTLAGGNTVQLSGVSTVGWTSQLWEIYEYPTGFALPAGWTNNNGIYTSSAVTPPIFTISAAATRWGKYLWRLTVNGGLLNGVFMGPLSAQPLLDELSGVQVLSPKYGFHDVGFRESNQFDASRQWVGELKQTLRLLETVPSPPPVAIAALNIDWSLGDVFYKTLAAGANVITFSNAVDGQTIVVELTGSVSTVTWPTMKWPGGVVPTQTSSGTDIITIIKRGAVYYASALQAMA